MRSLALLLGALLLGASPAAAAHSGALPGEAFTFKFSNRAGRPPRHGLG